MEPIIEQTQDDITAKWVPVIQAYEREAESWEKRAKNIIKRYKDERNTAENSKSRFNILWSNVETLKPALYAQTPKPEVERRFKDADAVGRVAADVLERCLSYSVNTYAYGSVMRQGVLDYLLTGRGTAWVRYVPHLRDVSEGLEGSEHGESVQLTDDAETDEDAERLQEVVYEEAVPDYVHWQDFGHNVARTWEEVTCVWRKVYLTRAQLVERFGDEIGNEVPLDFTPKGLNDQKIDESLKKATVYELWDKESKQAIWLSKMHPTALDVRDDPLKLDHFFPCPKPIHATLGNDSLIPVPDYAQYQDQAAEMDELTGRIASIVKAIKVVGVSDASAQGLQRLLAEGVENELIPVDQWAVHAEKGGLKGVMELLPVQEIAQTLLHLYEAREKVKQDLYEITGMSDILRGQTNPNETATAQNIKTRFVTMRLDEKQREIQRFARNIIEIMGQIIASHFSMETIRDMSGVKLLMAAEKAQIQQAQAMAQQAQQPQQPGMPPAPMPPQVQQMLSPDNLKLMAEPSWEEVYQLLQDNCARGFRIDIETDSTIAGDEQQQKQERTELMNVVGGYIEKMSAAPPALQPTLGEILLFTVRSYRVGKNVESMLEELVEKMSENAQKPPAPPQPDPTKMAEIQANQQAQAQQMQAQQQAEQMKMQVQAQADQARAQADAQAEQAKLQSQERLAIVQAQLDDQRHQREMEFQRWKAQLDAATKVEVAQITAKTSTDNALIAAESAAADTVSDDLGGGEAAEQKPAQDDAQNTIAALQEQVQQLMQHISKPRTVERDASGRAVSLDGRPIIRDANNRIIGVQ
jgi:hypothetical protein